jgi:hypothetical protein
LPKLPACCPGLRCKIYFLKFINREIHEIHERIYNSSVPFVYFVVFLCL